MISPSLSSRLIRYLSIGFAVSVVLFDKISPTLIALLLAVWVAEGGYRRKMAWIRESFFFTSLFVVLYLLYLVGLIYTNNFDYGLTDVFLKIPLFLFPLIFSTIGRDQSLKGLGWEIREVFALSVVVLSLFLLGRAGYQFIGTGLEKWFYYDPLSNPWHPSYLSMFVVFALAHLLQKTLLHFNRMSRLAAWLHVCCIIWLFVFAILLSSRAGVLSLLMVFVIVTVYMFTEMKFYLKGSLFLTGFIALFYLCYQALPTAFGRARNTAHSLENRMNDAQTSDGTVQRILIWETTIEIIKEHLLLGVGTGDVKDELLKAYQEKGMVDVYDKRKNVHNQFLQTFASIGLPGFIILMMGFLIPGLYAVWRHDLIYFLFLVIVGFNLLFESMLERQAGVFFYAFFNAVLFFTPRGRNQPDPA